MTDLELELVLRRAMFDVNVAQVELPAIEEALERMKLRSNMWGMMFSIEVSQGENSCVQGHVIQTGQNYCVFGTGTDRKPICLSCLALMLWAAGAHKKEAFVDLGDYFLPAQVKELMGWSSVRSVSTRAGSLKWQRIPVSRSMYAYRKIDVLAYRRERTRARLLRELGIKKIFPGDLGHDTTCPEAGCGGFAVEVPGHGWLCENGHRSPSK